MSIATPTAMRVAFENATANVPKNRRTSVYAMVRSAVNRKVGMTFRRSMWSVGHGRR
jgi:hypothetical protein